MIFHGFFVSGCSISKIYWWKTQKLMVWLLSEDFSSLKMLADLEYLFQRTFTLCKIIQVPENCCASCLFPQFLFRNTNYCRYPWENNQKHKIEWDKQIMAVFINKKKRCRDDSTQKVQKRFPTWKESTWHWQNVCTTSRCSRSGSRSGRYSCFSGKINKI